MCKNQSDYCFILAFSKVVYMCQVVKFSEYNLLIMAKRAGNISSEQRQLLVEYLKIHPELVSAKFSSDFTKKKAQELWQELTNNINAIPGAQKTWIQWRKTWHDMKSKTKGVKADIAQNFKKTGGGPQPNVMMSPIDDTVAELIGPTVIPGDATVNESVAVFDFDDNNNDGLGEERQCDGTQSSEAILDNTDLLQQTSVNSSNQGNKSPLTLSNMNTPKSLSIKRKVNQSSTSKVSGTRSSAAKRLETTLTYTQSLTDNIENDLRLRKHYYNKKLKLYERDVIAKERIADALEKILSADDSELTFQDIEYLDESMI